MAAGHEGDGIGLCAVTGHWMAEMLAGTLEEDLSPLDINRFKGGIHT
ncbi:hypothetical protein [Salinicoccus sp. CNSTN-B1]